ncbi:hypothetical protein niasHT_006832 [Heterodera trifolii]|uniref:Uncharacterized protein n=1 Tax=Heterodera trifolii TaxID=157864 RepID=A0ABD2M740_9BILA
MVNDPEPGVPMDVTPMAQCAFECFVFKVSAVRTNYRSWLRLIDPRARKKLAVPELTLASLKPRARPSTGPTASCSHHGHGRSSKHKHTASYGTVLCALPQQPLNDAQTPAQLVRSPHERAYPVGAANQPKRGGRHRHIATQQPSTGFHMCSTERCPVTLGSVHKSSRTTCARQRTGAFGGANARPTGQQSRAATGGVYKGQGRIQSELMTRPYSFTDNNCNDKHADFASVARVQPRTSKGITDLLLLNFVRLNTENPSKKLCPQKQ